MPRFAFTCPSVLWAIGAAPFPGETPASTPSEALSPSAIARDIQSLLEALDPFLTALHIAGYVPSTIAADLGFAACITIDLETMAVSDSTPWTATGAARPASAPLALAIQVEPRASFAGLAGVALDLPKLTAAVGAIGFSKTAKGWMVLTSSVPPPAGKRVVEHATTTFQAALSAAMTAICADVMAAAKAASTTSLKTCGLVGIYDPSLWTFARRDKDAEALRKIALVVASPAKSDAYQTLLAGQMKDVPKPFFRVFTDLGLESAQPTYSGMWKKLAARRYAMLHGTLDQKAKDAIDTMTGRGYTRAIMLLHALHIADVISSDDITPVTPEFTNPDLTGGYYRTDGVTDTSTRGRDTLQINQAGKYLVGRWQRHYDSSDATAPSLRRFRHFTFKGALTQDDGHQGLQFDCSAAWDPAYEVLTVATEFDNPIQIRTSVDSDGALLQITHSNGREEYRRKHSVPFLERGVVTRLGQRNPAFVGAQDAPLHPNEFAEVKKVVDHIEQDVTAFVKSGDSSARRVTAANLDVYLRKGLTSYGSSDGSQRFGELSEQGALVRTALIEIMLFRTIVAPNGETRSLWRWFEAMVAEQAMVTTWMQGFFKIAAAGTQHLYHWTLGTLDPMKSAKYESEIAKLVAKLAKLLAGAAKGESEDGIVEFQWTIGNMSIIKYRGKPEAPEGDPYWAQDYFAIVGGLGGGLTIGLEFAGSDEGYAESAIEWKPANFSGPLGGLGVKIGIGLGLELPTDDYTNAVWQTQMIMFYGDQQFDPLMGHANARNNVGLGFFVGLEIGGKAGYLWMPGADVSTYNPEDPVITGLIDPPPGGDWHFSVDSPNLTASGRQRIRELCAVYRANFEGVTTGLQVLGYASRSGTADHNLELSKKRAVSVYRAMREMLGDRFGVPEELTTVTGFGEELSKDADGTENPDWRRVDVVVDGMAVSHLWY